MHLFDFRDNFTRAVGKFTIYMGNLTTLTCNFIKVAYLTGKVAYRYNKNVRAFTTSVGNLATIKST
jgi:hypothetical protein